MSEQQEEPRWNPATRIAFRFVFFYYALPFVPFVLKRLPLGDTLSEGYRDFWDAVVVMAHEAFDIQRELDVWVSLHDWILFLCQLALCALAAAIWSVLDRNRVQYSRLHQVLRLYLRYTLAVTMIRYGAIKTLPTQMIAPPHPGVLQQWIGDIFPNHILWWTIGASPAFESLTGLAELLGGVLLLIPRTVLAGALLSAANMLLVFMLNMCYDVPVKLGSLMLLINAVILLAPDLRRLAHVFLFNRRAEPRRVPPLFANRWLDRAPHILLFLFGLYAIKGNFEWAVQRYEMLYPPRPPLYGLWMVEEHAVDGRSVPRFTDPARWDLVRILVPGSLSAALMDGSWENHPLDVDSEGRGAFSSKRLDENVLLLNGTLDSQPVKMTLRKAPLTRGDFQWISDRPDE